MTHFLWCWWARYTTPVAPLPLCAANHKSASPRLGGGFIAAAPRLGGGIVMVLTLIFTE